MYTTWKFQYYIYLAICCTFFFESQAEGRDALIRERFNSDSSVGNHQLFKVKPIFNSDSSGSNLTAPVEIFVNQLAYDLNGPKIAILGASGVPLDKVVFEIINNLTSKTVFTEDMKYAVKLSEWFSDKFYYKLDFSKFHQPGNYKIMVLWKGTLYHSPGFIIGSNTLAKLTLPSVLHYFKKQRANTPTELLADSHIKLNGSNQTVDLRGGWCDASGDVSKYFSHLAYANVMSPQQIPFVTWSLIHACETVPHLLSSLRMQDSIKEEAIWGADYIMRSLSPENYFYMTVFSYFDKDPDARRVVGLLANSVTTSDYQCAFREGGGMAIAALARISCWNKQGNFTSRQYLQGAERAFDHLLVNNLKYDDDGKENIIDEYCALMAATELWIATDSVLYRNEARKNAMKIERRMTVYGYFLAKDTNRPFWHASDAGMPVIALSRYLKKETDTAMIKNAMLTIRKSLDYEMKVTFHVNNPFGYPRQNFLIQGNVREGFFIPHENETGWWWQGENARLSSLAAAALIGGRLVYPERNTFGVKDSLVFFAENELNWILGCNPYSMCFMYGFGIRNVPYMSSNFGHGSEIGGISNGITGKDGNADGSGIDFKTELHGDEWRWTEQWLPHAAWYIMAITAMAESYENIGQF